MSTKNSFMSIVIICRSVIGIVSFNLSKTIYVQKSPRTQNNFVMKKIFNIGVDKDAFEEIIENGWIDMKGTDIN